MQPVLPLEGASVAYPMVEKIKKVQLISNSTNLLESTVKSIKENPVGGGSLSMFTHTSTKTLFSRPCKQKKNL